MLGETDQNHPPWPGTIVTMCVSYFMTGGPTKEHGTIFFFFGTINNKLPPTRKAQERSKGDAMCPTTF